MVSPFVNKINTRLELCYGLQQLIKVAFYLLSVSFLFVSNILVRLEKIVAYLNNNFDDNKSVLKQYKIRNLLEQRRYNLCCGGKLSAKLTAGVSNGAVNFKMTSYRNKICNFLESAPKLQKMQPKAFSISKVIKQ